MIRDAMQRLRHQWQRSALLWLLFRKGRITLRKVRNAFANAMAFRRRSESAGSAPTVAIIDISSHCSMYCITCRRSPDDLVDISGQTVLKTPLGSMSMGCFSSIVDSFCRDTLLITMYATGEPLLNSRVTDMVAYASDRGIATMLSTNGMSLDGEMSEKLLLAGIDYCKVAVSGFTQDAYGIYHRGGDVKRVLGNIAGFESVRRRLGGRCRVVVDYVLFEHNRHEEKAVRRFCHDNGIVFTLRYGRTFVDSGVSSPSESRCHYTPKITPCDWAWGVMVVCHDGRVVPCCQFATCAESPLVMGDAGDESAVAVWNGPLYRSFRRTQASGGRRSLPLCSNCFYSGIDFQS